MKHVKKFQLFENTNVEQRLRPEQLLVATRDELRGVHNIVGRYVLNSADYYEAGDTFSYIGPLTVAGEEDQLLQFVVIKGHGVGGRYSDHSTFVLRQSYVDKKLAKGDFKLVYDVAEREHYVQQ